SPDTRWSSTAASACPERASGEMRPSWSDPLPGGLADYSRDVSGWDGSSRRRGLHALRLPVATDDREARVRVGHHAEELASAGRQGRGIGPIHERAGYDGGPGKLHGACSSADSLNPYLYFDLFEYPSSTIWRAVSPFTHRQ